MKNKIYTLLITSCCYLGSLHAQNNTSPYSILGVGDVETGAYDRWSGMGNAGVALSSNRYLNQSNPASLSKLDDQFFVMEVSGRIKYINYLSSANTTANTNSSDISMTKLALGIKLTKRWGTGIGLKPFSLSNYSFYSNKTIQGTDQQVAVYNTGNGGLRQAYFANSYSVAKNLRAGVQLAYLFGSLDQKEVLSTGLTSDITTIRNVYLRSPYLTYGLQYEPKLSKKWQMALGATYAAQTKMNAEYTLNVTEGTSSIVKDLVLKNDHYSIPKTYEAGLGLTYNNKFTFSAAYKNQDWSTLNYSGLNYKLVNSDRYAAGIEYSKKINILNTNIETAFYQAGFFYNNSYLQINKEQLKDYGISLGIGGNSKRNALGYHVALILGSRGTVDKGLIKENYTQINFTLSYRDFWFTKGRKYD